MPGSTDDLRVSYPHAEPGFAFNGTLTDIASHHDAATARWVAKSLQYPTSGLGLSGSAWPWGLTLRLALLTATGMALAVAGLRLLRLLPARPHRHDADVVARATGAHRDPHGTEDIGAQPTLTH